MNAENIIKLHREEYSSLWDKHLRYINSNGMEGLHFLNPDILEELVNLSEEKILERCEKKGFIATDKEEYLAKIKKSE